MDPVIARAHDAARAILQEAGHVTGLILICEIERDGLTLAFDDDFIPPGPLADTLRQAADRLDPTVY